ncbi:glutathione S-transferase family protein [Erythrobacter sp. F6033]|uniref:glutathione S-transferase family protein n=1 Tax=Erythrobacter sp. F6033 TaxID=2926401 RepID=UPI001FF352DC|nr:glutathione S-transferase family protein [Erythrobacter sp. F6033]MCK0129242.1 glutathione S-transferase family protein [Erythrobacter sp. F6033]
MTVLGCALLGLIALALAWFAIEKSRRRTHPVTGGIDRSISLPHSAEVELYSNAFSHCSRKTRLVLAELGIETKHHAVDLIETGWYQTISADYLKVNPSGLVPTLVHQGHPVFESDDILAYAQNIARAGALRLVPGDPKKLAEMNDWLDFCAISSGDAMEGMESRAGACIPGLTMPLFVTAIQHIPLRNILVGFLFHFDKKRPALFTASKLLGLRFMMERSPARAIMHQSRDHMRAHLVRLNAALDQDGRDWILGGDYTLADITLASVLLRLDETGWLEWFEQTETIEHVSGYYSRLKARSAWTQAITAHAHPIVEQAKSELREAVFQDPALGEMIYGRIGSASVVSKGSP